MGGSLSEASASKGVGNLEGVYQIESCLEHMPSFELATKYKGEGLEEFTGSSIILKLAIKPTGHWGARL